MEHITGIHTIDAEVSIDSYDVGDEFSALTNLDPIYPLEDSLFQIIEPSDQLQTYIVNDEVHVSNFAITREQSGILPMNTDFEEPRLLKVQAEPSISFDIHEPSIFRGLVQEAKAISDLRTMTIQTGEFLRELIGFPVPPQPESLEAPRKEWAITALKEEIDEFDVASTIEDEADALIDLMYFAGGRIVEMGLNPKELFSEVHFANMRKQRGELSKRPGSQGYDAIKPDGWQAPNIEKFTRKPKIAICGHGRHGKDTVAQIASDLFGLSFTSSSLFCAEHIVFPWFESEYPGKYIDANTCFNDRANHREEWFNLISNYNAHDKAKLGREIFAENDIYCGIRNIDELLALRDSGWVDIIIWVQHEDRSPEGHGSNTILMEDCDVVIWNKGGDDWKYNLTVETARVLQAVWRYFG